MTAPSTGLHRAHVQRLLARHADPGVADGELLSRFAHQQDQRAFEALLRRHGPMVLATGRRVLGNPHDAEDILQATFLLLAQQASARRWQPCVAGWLHRTAHQMALKARRAETRRTHREERTPARAPTNPLAEMTGQELLAILDEELLALPEPMRTPLVLCYLEGLTRDEAAGRLGCPLATLKKRLERGRGRLHDALVRRGLGLSAVLFGSLLVGRSATAVPPPLVQTITHAVAALAAGNPADRVIPSHVLQHLHGGSSMVGGHKFKAVLAALLLGGLLATAGAVASGTGDDKPVPKSAPAAVPVPAPAPPAEPKPAPAVAKGIRGVVKDSSGEPVAGAAVVTARLSESSKTRNTTTDQQGRFAFDPLSGGEPPTGSPRTPLPVPGTPDESRAHVVVAKDGYAPAAVYASSANETTVVLPKAGEYSGTVKDRAGRPVAGAEVQFGAVTRNGNLTLWGYAPTSVLRGTPVEKAYLAKTDAAGAFRFTSVPDGAQLIFRVNATGFAERDTGDAFRSEYVVGPGAKPAALALEPEAIVRGRLTSRVPGVKPGGQVVRMTGVGRYYGRSETADEKGTFTFRGLPAGEISINVDLPEGTAATARGALVPTKAGATSEVNLEIIEGVIVTGRVRVRGTDRPVAGAAIGVASILRPKTGEIAHAITDASGTFTFRLPPGVGEFYVQSAPPGLYGGNGRDIPKVVIPEGVKAFELAEPLELTEVVAGLNGRVTDAAGKPMAHVKVLALQHSSVCPAPAFASAPVSASFDGTFQLPSSPNGPLEPGRSVPLRIETEDGQQFEAAALVRKDGVAEVRVPTLPGIKGPRDVKPDEVAGVVVDENGKPLAGVKVHVEDWVHGPENYTVTTGADGTFRIKDCGTDRRVQVRYQKDDYSPVLVTRQQVGVKGLVVAMDGATYFEGVVRGPDGKPVGGALVRADQGPKLPDGVFSTHLWTEAKADAEGRYRLYVQPDEYAFHVRVPGVGVARLPKTGIAHGQGQKLDIALRAGVTFKARVVDSVSGKPVAGLRLFDGEQKDIDGTSDAAGEAAFRDLPPGDLTFGVESTGHARWWSERATRERERKPAVEPKTGWQRNFDGLTFDLKPGMAAVTIVAEPGVRITGRVLDPAGKPVAGATVDPAHTGTGNSLSGDSRFGVVTKADGTFVLTLPASGASEYNLVAHDGKYDEWRTWANGTLPPSRTKPGQSIDGVELRLTRPAVVRGKVVDGKGQPVAGREVRAHAADGLENRYYDPTATTKADGTFELKFVRPAEQWVQVAPFWLHGSDAPAGTSRTLTLKDGQMVEDVTLIAVEDGPK